MTEARPSLDWLLEAVDVCAQELGVRPNWAVNAELLPEEGVLFTDVDTLRDWLSRVWSGAAALGGHVRSAARRTVRPSLHLGGHRRRPVSDARPAPVHQDNPTRRRDGQHRPALL